MTSQFMNIHEYEVDSNWLKSVSEIHDINIYYIRCNFKKVDKGEWSSYPPMHDMNWAIIKVYR